MQSQGPGGCAALSMRTSVVMQTKMKSYIEEQTARTTNQLSPTQATTPAAADVEAERPQLPRLSRKPAERELPAPPIPLCPDLARPEARRKVAWAAPWSAHDL